MVAMGQILHGSARTTEAVRLIEDVADIAEAQCLIVSQIDSPVDQPQVIEVSVAVPVGRASWGTRSRRLLRMSFPVSNPSPRS
jgi:S-adenosylmethionine synthetase